MAPPFLLPKIYSKKIKRNGFAFANDNDYHLIFLFNL